MYNTKTVRGYKVFNPDWTCRGKQYACPGRFEEDVELNACYSGMHFCKKAADCFNCYPFNPDNKVAEVIAYGSVVESGDICCTDKLEIVREVPWKEALKIVNTGNDCTGRCNSGNYNSGNYNSGNYNNGNYNSGDCNSGNRNSGNRNSGNCNSGNRNSGNWNSGNWNSGNCNIGNWNSGNWNSGDCNSGNWNSGNWNSGDWNIANFSGGCFNTNEPKIYLFNKPSEWTYSDWLDSEARFLLNQTPISTRYIQFEEMTDAEKKKYPYAEVTGGYIKEDCSLKNANERWKRFSEAEKMSILSLPNFDRDIFKEITGIDIDMDDTECTE